MLRKLRQTRQERKPARYTSNSKTATVSSRAAWSRSRARARWRPISCSNAF